MTIPRDPVSPRLLDALMCSSRPGTLELGLDPEAAKRVRGRAHYSARIHNAELTTRYADGVLTLKVTR